MTKRASHGQFKSTQIARLVSERPDLPEGIVEVTSPPYSAWLGIWKALRPLIGPALLAAGLVLAEALTPELLVQFGLPSALAVIVVEFGRNYAKQHGWKIGR